MKPEDKGELREILSVEYTQKELDSQGIYVFRRMPSGRKFAIQSAIGMAGWAIGIAGVIAILDYKFAIAVVALAGASVLYDCRGRPVEWWTRKLAKEYMRPSPPPVSPNVEIELNESGITIRRIFETIWVDWKGISGIECFEQQVVILQQQYPLVFVPFRTFASEDERDELMSAIKEKAELPAGGWG